MRVLTNQVWNVSEQGFPLAAAVETQLRFLLRFAILAPSPRNSQPWAFVVRENQVHLFADFARGQPVSDPDRRELYIALGCALENLLVAAEHFGFDHAVSYFPRQWHSDLVATVRFQPGGGISGARSGATLNAILRRYNDTGLFRALPISDEVQRRLQACCVESDLTLELTGDTLLRQWIHSLTRQADRIDYADQGFRMELEYWIKQGGGVSPLSGVEERSTDRHPGEAVARQDCAKVKSAPLLGWIRATGDSHLVHVRSGQLFERVWLTATALGITINPMSQTMRRPELRSTVAELIPGPGWIPQHLFRVGYSARRDTEHTPRRPVEDVTL